MKKLSVLGMMFLTLGLLTACGESSSSSEASDSTNSSSSALEVEESSSPKEATILDTMNEFAANTKSSGEIYVTGDIKVGEDQPVKPGIYDLNITGGSGNIGGDRKDLYGMSINWLGGAVGNEYQYPSVFRVILFEGDSLSFSDISKISLVAVPKKVTPSTELGNGEYIVGRDIPSGNYKLSTNVQLDPEFTNLGWDISIYDDSTGDTRDQSLTSENQDVAVALKDGEIITTSVDTSILNDSSITGDNAKLIFNKM
ncbi:hypothetical protein V6B05_07330 [Lactococcus garvieae]|uniref:hypothetical protein n=1 Tax=Lactococcus garvieae TaxID=1363 RepID=UPI001F61A481|nr:hypothetical protein [Lactococcus garvieae]MCI3861069.1 hypothetical protein [Lactococcus garvieae]